MTTKAQQNSDLLPRVSVLERGQDAIQRDIISLSETVKEQGVQLSNAVIKMGEIHQQTFNDLSKEIGSASKTDWQTFWTMIGTIMLIVAAIMAPVWMNFTYVDRENARLTTLVNEIKETQIENIKLISELKIKMDHAEKTDEENRATNRRGKTSD